MNHAREFSEAIFSPAFPLAGELLVEASAGTGKTHNIQNAYLRLVIAEGVPVQNILVVTFTEAATHELRDRLRNVLFQCRAWLECRQTARAPEPARAAGDPHNTIRLEQACRLPLAGLDESAAAAARLARARRALTDFDNAAIFTIHGFCKRVLDRYAFECGHDPDAELLPDPGPIIREVCRDWWREHTYKNPEFRAVAPFKNIGALEDLVRAAFKHPVAVLAPAADDCENAGMATPDAAASAAITGLETLIKGADSALKPNANARRLMELLSGLRNAINQPQRDTAALLMTLANIGKELYAAKWSAAQPFPDTARAPELKSAAAGKPGKRVKFERMAIELTPQLPGALSVLRRSILARMAPPITGILERIRSLARERGALTYDAMLLNVRDALLNTQTGPRLRKILRQEFKAAMIDEFQDTDPVQYEVFRQIFAHPDDEGVRPPLVFVGDPKQAIFGFRGGDVFTYYAAKQAITPANHHTLNRNFRAEENMVAAINEFFQDAPAPAPNTFLNKNIAYAGTLAANDVAPDRQLTCKNQRIDQPFIVRRYPSESARPGKTSAAAMRMYADVARETVRLLTDENIQIGARRIAPDDIAVLTLDHDEAARMHEALLAHGVNAIRQATDCVFDADEATGMARLMHAMLQPRHAETVRSALAHDIVPCPASDIQRFNSATADDTSLADGHTPTLATMPDATPTTLAAWMELLAEAGRHWHSRSFIGGFNFFAEKAGLRAHVAGLPHGARRLANLLHIVELAHQAARAQQLAPTALWRWINRQLDRNTRDDGDNDACKIRPACDERAVRIMTVFKSKGLQFPIVFAPTLWRRKPAAQAGRRSHLQYHDDRQRMIINFDVNAKDVRDCAERERLEEDVRLVYVALTRAINRVYLWTLDGSETRTDKCALDHVLALWRQRAGTGQAAGHIAETPADDVAWDTVPEKCPAPAKPEIYAPTPVNVDKTHGHASFTSLMSHDDMRDGQFFGTADEFRDVDAMTASAAPASAMPETAAAGAEFDIFSIPGGARTGDCWHGIFENLDFQADAAGIRAVIDAGLDRFNICAGPTDASVRAKREAVHSMVQRVLEARLDAGHGSFTLRDIPASMRRSELTFQFALDQRGPERTLRAVGEIINRHWRTPARNETFISRMLRSEKRLPLGFMAGSIDLIFQHQGRFHVIDWKSNRMGGRAADFDPPGLTAGMAANSYFLQYLIYTVAAHGFLRQTLRGYDYDKHFGGVFYIFTRGVDGTPRRGIFADRPSAALIENLSDILAGG